MLRMDSRIKPVIALHWEAFIADLAEMIQVESVRGAAADAAPFGSGPKQALTLVAQMGQTYGFKTGIVNDAMAYVQWGDDDTDYLGIVGHLDVVAAGSGWHTPPFELTRHNGTLYGRGVLDNKGPIMACLYGMKLLRDMGFQPAKTIRLIFGADEESGCADVPLYLEHEAPPQFGFTPDGKYPVVYGERGIVNYALDTTLPAAAALGPIVGEQAKDHVPDQLSTTLAGQVFKAVGKRAPTNAPELGVNALTELAKQIVAAKLGPEALQAYFAWIVTHLADQHHGQGLDLALEDADSGALIMTPYRLSKTAAGLRLELAIRYPVSVSEATVTARLQSSLPPQTQLQVLRRLPGVMHDQTRPEIQTLSAVYGAVTGLDPTPVTTTGATYARVMPNILAFGPSFPGQKGIAHKQDEWMTEDDLAKNMQIYMQSMLALTKG